MGLPPTMEPSPAAFSVIGHSSWPDAHLLGLYCCKQTKPYQQSLRSSLHSKMHLKLRSVGGYSSSSVVLVPATLRHRSPADDYFCQNMQLLIDVPMNSLPVSRHLSTFRVFMKICIHGRFPRDSLHLSTMAPISFSEVRETASRPFSAIC